MTSPTVNVLLGTTMYQGVITALRNVPGSNRVEVSCTDAVNGNFILNVTEVPPTGGLGSIPTADYINYQLQREDVSQCWAYLASAPTVKVVPTAPPGNAGVNGLFNFSVAGNSQYIL